MSEGGILGGQLRTFGSGYVRKMGQDKSRTRVQAVMIFLIEYDSGYRIIERTDRDDTSHRFASSHRRWCKRAYQWEFLFLLSPTGDSEENRLAPPVRFIRSKGYG